jgi:pterin-4a-carbinolamine dehydratase
VLLLLAKKVIGLSASYLQLQVYYRYTTNIRAWITFSKHQRKGISWADVNCASVMSYLYHNCWYKGFSFFRQLHYYCYCTTSCKTNNQLLLQAIQGHKKSFLTHQRKGISWADVDCTSAMSYLYHNCWYKGFNFFTSYTTTVIALHHVKEQSATAAGHSRP